MLTLFIVLACVGYEDTTRHAPDMTAPREPDSGGAPMTDTSPPGDTGQEQPCPSDMVLVDTVCMDRYEAPNRAGALPLVMYSYDEALAWCQARDKRLCFEDEWLLACQGHAGTLYPYGDTHDPGRCNDEETWLTYSQSSLNYWPGTASTPEIESLEALLQSARDASSSGYIAADHVEWLYQGEGSGTNNGCGGEFGVYDLSGNIEEWTTCRSGSGCAWSGNLRGRYWAESRTCQSSVTTHGDSFHFYEIGFRCCLAPETRR